jgi:hypothetical protein
VAVLGIIGPRLVAVAGNESFVPRNYFPIQGALYREGDILTLQTVGTILTPAPTGALATFAGPTLGSDFSISGSTSTITQNGVTIAAVTAAAAPANSYYIILTYTAAGTESLAGTEFIVNSIAGYVPSVNVAAAGAPAGATNFAYYVALISGSEALQQATRTTTALGATFTTPYPFTNSTGVNRATNTASTVPIVGIAQNDVAAVYATGVGGSFVAGGPGNVLGTWGNPYPLGQQDPVQTIVVSLAGNQPIEISLKQPWSNALIGATAGIVTDATTGFHILDTTQANKLFTIQAKVTGSNADVGVVGDVNSRVQAFVNAGAI